MPLISLTRLRLRSWVYLPQFFLRNESSIKQLTTVPGFLRGQLLLDRRLTFWTMTAWQDEASMRAYRGSGAHQKAMPKLAQWCDEASVAHWVRDTEELPDWQQAYEIMVTKGRVSKVERPSPDHAAKSFAPPQTRLVREVAPKQEAGLV